MSSIDRKHALAREYLVWQHAVGLIRKEGIVPLPFIMLPILAGTAVAGAIRTYTAKHRISRAKEREERSRTAYESAIRRHKRNREYAQAKLDELGQIRLRATVVLGKAVAFLKKARLKSRDLFERCDLPEERIAQWEAASINAVDVLGGLAGAAASGVGTAAAAYGLVGVLGAASTGTAISTLTGVAASNATLAWLGGGALAAGGGGIAAGTMVLGGLVTAPAILIVSFVAHAQADKVEAAVERNVAEFDRVEAEMAKQSAGLDAMVKRVDEAKDSTLRVQSALEEILAQSNPKDKADAFRVAKAATSLGKLLDVAILDGKGSVEEEV